MADLFSGPVCFVLCSDLQSAGSQQLHRASVGDSGVQRSTGTGPPTGLRLCQQNDEEELRSREILHLNVCMSFTKQNEDLMFIIFIKMKVEVKR